MVETFICLTFIAILLLCFLLLYLFLDTYVNQKTELHNAAVKAQLRQIIFTRIENINHQVQPGEPAYKSLQVGILKRFLSEVSKY